jgi:Zonular occludens toxin (Zot).
MYLMGFDGTMGQGKTFGMSTMAQYFRQKSGCTLYSNYGLKHSKLFTSFEDFLDVAQQPSSIICLDEIHTDLDSRSVNTNASKYLTHMLFYLRKIRATIFFSSPDITNVDLRVRLVMNIYCRVRKNKKSFYYEMYDMQKMKYLKTLRIEQKKAFAIGHQIYDTNKMVVPMEFPSDRESYVRVLNNLKSISDQYYEQAKDEPERDALEAVAGLEY